VNVLQSRRGRRLGLLAAGATVTRKADQLKQALHAWRESMHAQMPETNADYKAKRKPAGNEFDVPRILPRR
jgi:hypothetical protein